MKRFSKLFALLRRYTGMRTMLHGLGPDRNHPCAGCSQLESDQAGLHTSRRWIVGVITLALLSMFSQGLTQTYYVEGEATWRHFHYRTSELIRDANHVFRLQRDGPRYRIELVQTSGVVAPGQVTEYVMGSDGETSYALIGGGNQGVSYVYEAPYPDFVPLTAILWLAYCSDSFFATNDVGNRFRMAGELAGYESDLSVLKYIVSLADAQPHLPSSIEIRAPGYSIEQDGRRVRLPAPLSKGWLLNQYTAESWLSLEEMRIPLQSTYRRLAPLAEDAQTPEARTTLLHTVLATNAAARLVLDTQPAFEGRAMVLDFRFPELRGGRIKYSATNKLWRSKDEPEVLSLVAEAVAEMPLDNQSSNTAFGWALLLLIVAPAAIYIGLMMRQNIMKEGH